MFMCTISATALAQDAKSMSIQDFAVDWKDYVGKKVTVLGGQLRHADQEITWYSVQGVSVIISSPWADKEDFRFVLKNCTDADPLEPSCYADVSGVVGKELWNGNYPVLLDPDLIR
jgi:hypothetical protein